MFPPCLSLCLGVLQTDLKLMNFLIPQMKIADMIPCHSRCVLIVACACVIYIARAYILRFFLLESLHRSCNCIPSNAPHIVDPYSWMCRFNIQLRSRAKRSDGSQAPPRLICFSMAFEDTQESSSPSDFVNMQRKHATLCIA